MAETKKRITSTSSTQTHRMDIAEHKRLRNNKLNKEDWNKWGPYLSERQWGTVREDYSPDGSAWDYFSHDHARSRAYRWGEDGIAGFSDNQQRLCIGLALWNERDPILKERMFGLTNSEGNHGEDVKEIYYYLDATPTHSYMKMLYKYPQSAFPYSKLVDENRNRGLEDPEYEIIDTGVFDEDRYFDVFVEYAKGSPTDILMSVTIHNRGPEDAVIHVLPQIWFRNTWTWRHKGKKPGLQTTGNGKVQINHPDFRNCHAYLDGDPEILFCDNETNTGRLYGTKNGDGYSKDAFHEYLVNGRQKTINPNQTGTKAAGHYSFSLSPGAKQSICLRLNAKSSSDPFKDFDRVMMKRKKEADEFYGELQKEMKSPDACHVQRQAFAGMIWSKQFYYMDIREWLEGDETQPPPPDQRKRGRNHDWEHLNNADVLSMPDKWEYPWYAAWDLAFHCIPLALVDPEFAKNQLVLLTREWYMHSNGQLAAYEWAFEDVNPPVHAWATWRVYKIDKKHNGGQGDLGFLERVFHKLLLNFTWWVNRKDADGHNLFQGGFLGLDNIGLFDRSSELPGGYHIHQSDGTSWMAMYSLNLMRIALELARHNHNYEDIASKFFEHFLSIAKAMTDMGGEGIGLWDDEDKFYYDVLHGPGDTKMMKVRSLVGLIPLFAVETIEPELLNELPEFAKRLEWILENRPDLASLVSRWSEPGRSDERRLLSLLRGHRMKRLLYRMLDESEFLSDYGVRGLSQKYKDEPYTLAVDGQTYSIKYQPAESDTSLFGGNSNWRGPIWFPVNFLQIESLQKFHHYYGDDFKIEYPSGSNNFVTINDVANKLSSRLCKIFLRDEHGRRAVFGDNDKFQNDPYFRDHLFFYEYFDGDTGRGVGASHQTGWTGLVAKLLQTRR